MKVNGFSILRVSAAFFAAAAALPASSYAEAGGGLYATVDDFMRFFYMLAHRGVSMDGRRILSAEICQEWYRRQTPPHEKTSYSFGMRVDPAKGTISHGGAYATHGLANWKDGTFNVRFVQKCGLPRRAP